MQNWVKHDFQLANKKISSGNVCMVQNCFTLFDCNSCLWFKLSTARGTLNESVVIQWSWSNSIAITQWNTLKYTHGTLQNYQNHNNLLELKRSYLVLNKEERKQERIGKLTASFHLTVEVTRRSNYNLNPWKLRTNKVTAETTKRL